MADIISHLVNKLIFNMKEETQALVKEKTSELLRRLESKSIQTKCSDYCKAVICFDIASSLLEVQLDKKSVLKFAKLGKLDYVRCKRTFEKVLDILQTTDIAKTCVQLNLMSDDVQKLAEKLLLTYKKNIENQSYHGLDDLNHPQYTIMAIYQACKNENVKVSKKKLVELSFLKPAQFEKLEKSWNNLLNLKKQSPKKNSDIQENVVELYDDIESNSTENENDDYVYESWRDDLLERAYLDLKVSKKLIYLNIMLFSYANKLKIQIQKWAFDFLNSYKNQLIECEQVEEDIGNRQNSALAIFFAFDHEDTEPPLEKLLLFSDIDQLQWNDSVKTWKVALDI